MLKIKDARDRELLGYAVLAMVSDLYHRKLTGSRLTLDDARRDAVKMELARIVEALGIARDYDVASIAVPIVNARKAHEAVFRGAKGKAKFTLSDVYPAIDAYKEG